MTVSAYRYQSDTGVTYQVALPNDFAASLNYVIATGFETYLPDVIAMRYATYKNNSLGVYATVPVLSPFSAGNPPVVVVADSVVYHLASSYGEKVGAYPSTGIMVMAGPQGAPGAAGAAGPAGATGPQGPAGLGPHSYRTSAISFSAGTVVSFSHGLGRYPYFVRAFWSCISANNGYSIGDELEATTAVNYYYQSGVEAVGQNVAVTSTTLYVMMAGSGTEFILNKSTAGVIELPPADWSLFVDLW